MAKKSAIIHESTEVDEIEVDEIEEIIEEIEELEDLEEEEEDSEDKPDVETYPSNMQADNKAKTNRIYIENPKERKTINGFIFPPGITEMSATEFSTFLQIGKNEIASFEKSTGLILLDLEEDEEYEPAARANQAVKYDRVYLKALSKPQLKALGVHYGAKGPKTADFIKQILKAQEE